MSLDSVRLRFERRQADLFRDEATIVRPAAGTTLNTSTGVETPDATTAIYDGPCLIRGFGWEGTDAEVGGSEVRLRRYRVKFAVDVATQIDDIVTPTVSTYDVSLVGRSLRVTDVPRDGWQISRWLICEEVAGDV